MPVIWLRVVTTSPQNGRAASQEKAVKEMRRDPQAWLSFWAPDILGHPGQVTEAYRVPMAVGSCRVQTLGTCSSGGL